MSWPLASVLIALIITAMVLGSIQLSRPKKP
jgi:hypothetical protein